jgi:hypothetical protein
MMRGAFFFAPEQRSILKEQDINSKLKLISKL